ncbi:hypothetical protein [Actinoplanes sp. NPDC051851]|uniref:hypothetical protein n=1 Tax=Actinoplanes sp. NPDC051851 TaxID=3154753 RepID=UPI00342901B2
MIKKGVRIRFLLVAVLGIAATAAAFPAQAGAAARAGLVRYAAQDPAAAHVTLRGTKVAGGGCRFTATGTGSAGETTAVQQVETAFDAATCTSYLDRTEVAAGTTATATVTRSGGSGRGAAGTTAGPEEGVSAQVASCYNPYRSTAYYYSSDACIHSWFQDAYGNHLNDVRNEVQWNPYNGCATYGYSYASNYWSYASGWINYLNGWTPSFSCSGVTSQSSVGFYTNSYCGYSYDYYSPGYLTGYGDGSYAWSVTWYKSSSCTMAFGLLNES